MSTSTLIVGLGRIGMGYDLLQPRETHAFTHARAFATHPKFTLVGGVDPNAEQRALFTKHYGAPAFATVAEALASTHPELVVVAVPTALHLSTVEEVFLASVSASQKGPRALLCEKPLAHDPRDAQKIADLCQKNSCKLFVNYMRRSDVGALAVAERIRAGQIQKPVRGVVWYSKGLLNSASHLVNLLELWLGAASAARLVREGRVWSDGTGTQDPEPEFQVSFPGGDVTFLPIRAEDTFTNSIELFAPNGRLRYENGGAQIFWQPAQKGQLNETAETLPSDFTRVQWQVADQLARALDDQNAHVSTGLDALQTLRLLAPLVHPKGPHS